MKFNFKNTLHILLAIFIIASLSFIFIQSSLPYEKSVKQSQIVEDIIDNIIGNNKNDQSQISDKGGSDESSSGTSQNQPEDSSGGISLRKIAHFLEHGIFGMLLFSLGIAMESEAMGREKTLPLHPIRALFLINIGILVALIDETIQIFSKRGSSVKDIWLDIFGFVSIAAITYLTVFLIRIIRRRSRL